MRKAALKEFAERYGFTKQNKHRVQTSMAPGGCEQARRMVFAAKQRGATPHPHWLSILKTCS